MLATQTIKSMSTAADAVIGDVLLRGSRGMQTTPRTEVGLVAAVTLGGVNDVAAAWRPLLATSEYSLSLTGVFCHAAPLVRFRPPSGTASTCELGDLLVVVDRKRSGTLVRNANLIQAKMAAKAMRVNLTGASSARQLVLYQLWPLFSFVDGIYGTGVYDLGQGAKEDAGTFGIIDRHFRSSPATPPVWTQHRARPTPKVIATEPMLGTFIANMAAANWTGYGRRAWPGGKDDWSKVVDLLLTVTYARAFRHAPTLGASAPHRGSTAMAYFLTTPTEVSWCRRAGGDWWPPFDGFEVIEDDSPGGISVLHLRLAELEEKETG
jgi:hypothetical protein